MPKIRFTAAPKIPNDMVDKWKDYKKDSIHDVSDSEAERWLRRGNAEILTTRQANLIVKEEMKKEEEKVLEIEVKEIVSTPTVSVSGTVGSSGTTTSSGSGRSVPRHV